MKLPVYMDHHATTPLDPRVREAMEPALAGVFGNPSSSLHAYGWDAGKLVNRARGQAAALIEASPEEILFTSGTTESNNLAIKGLFEIHGRERPHIISQKTEHKSVLAVLRYLEKQGARISWLPVDSTGQVCPEELDSLITDQTLLISVMMANNETGTIQPVACIGSRAKEKGIYFHVDAAQAAGKIPLDVNWIGADLLSFSGHKMYGPKGAGVLYVRRRKPRVRLAPLLHGGDQEQGLRSGTLNVAGIAGLGTACELAGVEMGREAPRICRLRDRLEEGLKKRLSDVRLNGHPGERLPGSLNMSFGFVDSEAVTLRLGKDIAVSSSSACASGNADPSYVLQAMGVPRQFAHNALRFGLGRFTTEEEVDYVIERVVDCVTALREVSPLYEVENKTLPVSAPPDK